MKTNLSSQITPPSAASSAGGVSPLGTNPIVNPNPATQALAQATTINLGRADVFRLNSPEAHIFTHFDKQHNTQNRLDFFLVDDNLVNLPICCSNITHGFNSDHSYVSLTLQGNPLNHGRGYWKLNN